MPRALCLSAPGTHSESLERTARRLATISAETSAVPRALPRGGPAPPDAPAPQVRGRRLQLPASGSLRRARIPPADGDPAVKAWRRLRRRRVRSHRTAAENAISSRGGSPAAGYPRNLPRQPPPWRQSHPARIAIHAWHHFSRRQMKLQRLNRRQRLTSDQECNNGDDQEGDE